MKLIYYLMDLTKGAILTAEFIVCVALAIGIIFLFGLIMRHLIVPAHDRIWKFKRKKIKKISAKELFMDGLFFMILIFWVPFLLLLAIGSLYVAITSIISGNILNSILGVALSLFFGIKLWYMFEHRSKAKKRWKKRK